MQKRMLPPNRARTLDQTSLSHKLVKETAWRHSVALHAGLGDALGGGFLGFADEDFLEPSCGLKLRIDTVVEFVPHTGHGQQHRWLDLDALVGNLGQIRDEVDVDATADHPVQVKGGPEGVSPRQEGSVLVTHVDGERRLHTEDVGERVPVGEHDALGVARGTGGVNQRVERKRVVSDLKHLRLAACGHKFRPCVDGHAFGRQLVGGFVTQKKDAAGGHPLASLGMLATSLSSTAVSATARRAGVESPRM